MVYKPECIFILDGGKPKYKPTKPTKPTTRNNVYCFKCGKFTNSSNMKQSGNEIKSLCCGCGTPRTVVVEPYKKR